MSIVQQRERAGGIDIHKNKAVVCLCIAKEKEEVKEYGIFTKDLEQIRDDLLADHIREVIIESTGIYWISLCNILTLGGIHVTVVNPQFIKNMPKEKTDKKDARWLCKLLVNGLVRPDSYRDSIGRTTRLPGFVPHADEVPQSHRSVHQPDSKKLRAQKHQTSQRGEGAKSARGRISPSADFTKNSSCFFVTLGLRGNDCAICRTPAHPDSVVWIRTLFIFALLSNQV